ncbi:MAG TPA: spore germination protein [Symbiobacteriaceae bacterium]
MQFWQWLKRSLDPSATFQNQAFSLGDRGSKPAAEERGSAWLKDAEMRTERVLTHIDSILQAASQGTEALAQAGDITPDLSVNRRRLEAMFRLPVNKDLILREVEIATQPPTRAVVCFMEGLVDRNVINRDILQPLMLLTHLAEEGEHGPTRFSLRLVVDRLLPGHQVSEKQTLKEVADSILSGDTVLLFDGERTAIAVETKQPPVRSVTEPKVEQTIQGPHDSFVEAFRMNVAMVRRRLKDPRVVTEILTVGQVSSTYVAVMYIDGVVNPKLVAEVKRRIQGIRVDTVTDVGVLAQYVEDAPSSLMPTSLTTERPDRTAAYLAEGHVAVFVDNSPHALIFPVTFWSLFQTAEDYYLRYPFGSFLRYTRLASVLTSLTVPALYIALVNYHREMIPTELMLFLAAARETVPMPSLVELLLMEISFELIREAATRIPNIIGPTIGLVASLILGQAAVEARIVSPLLILVVAITGLASFALPNVLASFAIRLLRFALLIAAAVLGFYGLAAGMLLLVVYLSGMRSVGVPYLAPVAPRMEGSQDTMMQPPAYTMEFRPRHVRPVDERRQADITRPWDPMNRAGTERNHDSPQEGGSP